MTQLHLTPEEFATFVLIFLMDKVVNPEEVVNKDDRFNEFIEKNSSRLLPILMKYYLSSNAAERLNYKRVKDIFDAEINNDKGHTIKITSVKSKKEKEKEKGFLKRLISKIIGNESLDVEDKNLLVEYISSNMEE